MQRVKQGVFQGYESTGVFRGVSGGVSGVGVLTWETYVVFDDHDIANPEGTVESPGGVGDEEDLYSKCLHDAHGEGQLLGGIPLVGVQPPNHAHNRLPPAFSKNKLSDMTRHCRKTNKWCFRGVSGGRSASLIGFCVKKNV